VLKVNPLGDNLQVIITAEYNYFNDWMAFASWYSLSKNVPDAAVTVACKPPDVIKKQVFSWPKKCGVPFVFTDEPQGKEPALVMPCGIMAIREFDQSTVDYFNVHPWAKPENEICSQPQEDRFLPFVDPRGGFGNFVVSDWIDTLECPFPWADRFMTHSAGANEVRILKLWKQLAQVYATVSRG
jgi:hypothetical protein